MTMNRYASCQDYIKFLSILILFVVHFDLTHAQIIDFKTTSKVSEAEIRNELSVYPPNMLKMVKTIIVEPLDGNSVGVGGFNWISISTKCSGESLRRTIHHELSTVFLKQPDIFKTFNKIGYQFTELNGDSLRYYSNRNGVDLPITDLTEKEKDYFAVNSYAKSNFENDYNMICEELFVNGKNFIDSIESKPETVIYKKVMIVIDYYHSLDPKFIIDFFRLR